MSSTDFSRRDFLKTSLVGGAVLTAGTTVAASGGSQKPQSKKALKGNCSGKRPNVLWIQSDEHRPDSIGCYGSSWAHTPNLDRMAAQGTVFHECHVQSPVCVPSRTSMLACKYPQELNVLDNAPSNQPGYLTAEDKMFPNLFADAGYRTANIGKWHTPRHATWQTNDLFILFDDATGFYALGDDYSEKEHRVVKRPKGASIIMGGIYPYHDWGINPSSHITDMAIDWLQNEAVQDDKPFMLRVSHLWPHTPVLVPEPWDKLYGPDDVPCRALNKSVYRERAAYDRGLSDGQGGFELSMDTWKQVCADYYGLCSYVDFEVGRIIQALEELGLAENTIIAFNADHGKNLGEVGICEKDTFDRESWRVPFIMSWPGHLPEGEHRHDIMELMDFGPTLCSLAGIAMPSGMRGRDLFHSEEPDAVFGIIHTWNHWLRAGIRTDRYRYDCTFQIDGEPVADGQHDPNLFDLKADPHETHNLIHDPSMIDIAASLQARLEKWYRTSA